MTQSKNIILAFLALFFTTSVALAQRPENIRFRNITQQQGLSQSNVTAIQQDDKGFMWFGTRNGLNKYDGYEITVYQNDLGDSTSIAGNDVRDILEDKDGNIWIATFSGLNKYNRQKDSFRRYQSDSRQYALTNNIVTSLYEDSRGYIWVGTDAGLNRIDREAKTITHYLPDPDNPNSLSHEYVMSITEDAQGNIWVGTYQGLNKLNPDTRQFTRYLYTPDKTVPQNRVSTLYRDSRDILWVGTQGGGLVRYNSIHDSFIRYTYQEGKANSISHNVILSLSEDHAGRLWIGTENGGLNIMDVNTGRFWTYTENRHDDESISNNSIYSVYRDGRNNMWLGTYSGGVNYYAKNAKDFVHFQSRVNDSTSLNDNNVEAIDVDPDGNIWLATDGGGMNKMDPQTKRFTHFIHQEGTPNSIAGNYLLSLMVDSHGNVWSGTWGDGVSVYDPKNKRFTHYKYHSDERGGLTLNNISNIYEDSRGDVWISTIGGGLNVLDTSSGQFTYYQRPDDDTVDSTTISDDYPVISYEDREGNIWIGTEAVGLFLYNRKTGIFRHFEQKKENSTGLRGNKVFDIFQDSQNRLWICMDDGLNQFHYSDSTFTAFSQEDGLPTDVIKSILEDDHGNLWLGTSKGLSKFNPADTTFSNYAPSDGLQGNEFNGNAALKVSDGRMYFGGNNGFNVFHPDSIRQNSYVPPVVITQFQVFNKTVPVGDDSPLQKQVTETERIVLSHKQSVFSFKFAALNYTSPEKNRYAYKMEGFDKQWNYVGNKRTATYTNLNPGEYVFKVKASNNDGVWNEEGTELAVVITPPFWQTTWFYLLSCIIIAGLVFGAYRWKVRNIRRQNEQLEEMVEDRTSELNKKNRDLKKALQDLEATLKELKKTRSELVEKAHKAGMADVATGVLHNVGNILNSINASTSVMGETLKNSHIKQLKKANDLMREQIDDFGINDPQKKMLLEYYLKIEEPIGKEYERLKTQKNRLQEKVDMIIEVIGAQQNLSRADVVTEKVEIPGLFENTLTLQAGSIERHGLKIERNFEEVQPVSIEKTKVMHIIFNLLKNAKEAMKEANVEERTLSIHCWQDEEYVHLSISDNGVGIREQDLGKVFTHGFTTKKKGHGFGLHSSANYMRQMDGKIKVDSDGLGKGATFTLSFSRNPSGTSSTSIDEQDRNGSQSQPQEIIELD